MSTPPASSSPALASTTAPQSTSSHGTACQPPPHLCQCTPPAQVSSTLWSARGSSTCTVCAWAWDTRVAKAGLCLWLLHSKCPCQHVRQRCCALCSDHARQTGLHTQRLSSQPWCSNHCCLPLSLSLQAARRLSSPSSSAVAAPAPAACPWMACTTSAVTPPGLTAAAPPTTAAPARTRSTGRWGRGWAALVDLCSSN